jgi:hypothetical protein
MGDRVRAGASGGITGAGVRDASGLGACGRIRQCGGRRRCLEAPRTATGTAHGPVADPIAVAESIGDAITDAVAIDRSECHADPPAVGLSEGQRGTCRHR